ncbi:MAG: peptidase M23, partial [Halioglobus sp.]|nr:peptidase M23 [Halioglobus sp.]
MAVLVFTSGDEGASASVPATAIAPLAAVTSSPSAEPHLESPAPVEPATAEFSTPVAAELPWVSETVRSGDNLSLIFKRAGYSGRDVHEVVTGAELGKSLERIFPGQTIAFQADDEGELAAVRHIKSPLETVTYERSEQGFASKITLREPEVREAWATGKITSSLFIAGQEAGLSQNLIMELANIFGGVIDFVLDPRKGDTIQLIYEQEYLDGEKFRDGDIIAASFTNRGETFNAYRYTDANGDPGYFNEDGVSMRKAFLMAPVDFTRISS